MKMNLISSSNRGASGAAARLAGNAAHHGVRRVLQGALATVAVAAMTVAASGAAYAQGSYPNKPIRVVVPWTAGGAGDIIARPIMAKLSERLGQPIVIDDKGGASGLIGVADVAKAAPDGYTFLVAHVSNMAIFPALEPALPYNSARYFAPVTSLVISQMVLVVRPTLPIKTVADLVAYAKANPGKVNYGSAGSGGTTHLAAVLFSNMAGINMLHVPYKGVAPVFSDLIGGQIDIAFVGSSGAIPLIASGKLRALGVLTPGRVNQLPGVPTIAETYPGFEVNSWYGVMAPAGTPRDIVARVQRELAAVLKTPEIIKFMQTTALEPVGNTPDQFSAQIKQDVATWATVVKSAGLVKEGAK